MRYFSLFILTTLVSAASCSTATRENITTSSDPSQTEIKTVSELPPSIQINGVAQNPEGIEYNPSNQSFYLSSLNAGPILRVLSDGSYEPFSKGDPFPLSTAGLQLDLANNRMLAAAFNAAELYDGNSQTRGTAHLRAYDLDSGALLEDIDLSTLIPDAPMYFANDIAIDSEGNAFISDWFARAIYKVDINGNSEVFWTNTTFIEGGPNGLDITPDGSLLVSVINDGTYSVHGLVKIPLSTPKNATIVDINDYRFAGFDGMVVTPDGNVLGVSNNGNIPGGNTLVELTSKDNWSSAEIVNFKNITTSTTVAYTETGQSYVINQDFQQNDAMKWTIERIDF